MRQGLGDQPDNEEAGVDAEWLPQHMGGGVLMALAARVKQLRNEHGCSQGGLAEQIGTCQAE